MTGYHGRQVVKAGDYLNRSTWELESVAEGGGILPGDESTHYIGLPRPPLVIAGPLMGLAYVIFLPVVFWFAVIYYLVAGIAPGHGEKRVQDAIRSEEPIMRGA